MFRESGPFVGACIIDGFDLNCFTNMKQVLTCLNLSKQYIFVLFQKVLV